MAKETNRIDIYQAVTDDILAMLEAGTKPWVKPWSGGPTIPLRHNGVAYRGINVLSLWASAMRQGFASPYWLTFKQALELGGNVRKGSKGTTVVYANKLVVKDSETDDERAIPFLKRYTVFNADQVEGLDGKYPAPAPIITNPETRDVELELMFSRIDATVRIGGSQAYYHTRDDYIQMPAFEAFHSADDYYATLAHEAVHHAGHESRLNRKTLISTSRADYARDELVAELGASFIGAIVGFKVEEREDHAAYIEHWLTALRNDKRAIFEAAREAQNAADYLLAMMTDQAD
ncbi:MAG: antirestriction protein [Alphaproteobacteria bacterium HGW-Alphaproteobacteria-13]|nr:MAG: antirestriction protein [Alphaproteobacteria bacterium HGW-Alphaproteobacteria-13]